MSGAAAQTPSQETLAVARRGGVALGPLAARGAAFVSSQRCGDGGFRGRAGGSDLYYTSFAIELLCALDVPVPETTVRFVSDVGAGAGLDFMHAACLARCWARLPEAMPQGGAQSLLPVIMSVCAADGGFHTLPGQPHGSATGAFLVMHALHDLGLGACLDGEALLAGLHRLRTPDGGYANEVGMRVGTTLAAAGVQTLYAWLGKAVEPSVGDWLVSQMHAEGGFCASPEIAMPDLLTTATVLYALGLMGCDLAPLRAPCESFVDGLMEDNGGYSGHWFDDTVDLEYTYYGLVALGVLAGESFGGQS